MGQKYLKRLRVGLALVFFLAVILTFSDVKGNLPSAFTNIALFLQFIPSLLELFSPKILGALGFIIVLLLTILAGRIYCSAICPLGIFQDLIIWLRRKISPKKRYKFRKAYNLIRYPILILGTISLLFGGILFFIWLDPYAVFGRMGTHLYQPVLIFANNLIDDAFNSSRLIHLEPKAFHAASFVFAGGMLLIVGSMSYIAERLYCNTICPVGTLLGLVSKISVLKLRINQSECTKCGKCQAACKANCIDIKTLSIDESRCINCFNCIPVCENTSIGYKMTLSNKLFSKPVVQTDSTRRLFLASATGYLALKAGSVAAAGKHGDDDHTCYYSRGVVAPPGAMSIEYMTDRCVGCHLCVSVCPTKVLQPSWLEYGFTGMLVPRMDFFKHFCNYDCTKCGEVCPTGAITQLPVETKKLTQIGKVQFVKEDCIVETEGTACGSCSEHCPTQAVKMVPYKNGLTIPETDRSICIGCGACEYACPVVKPHKAIFVVSNAVHVLAEKPRGEKIEYQETEEFPF